MKKIMLIALICTAFGWQATSQQISKNAIGLSLSRGGRVSMDNLWPQYEYLKEASRIQVSSRWVERPGRRGSSGA